MTAQKPNYWEYVRVEELLSLQSGLEASEEGLTNDEVLFITVHQVYELWFKLVRRELGTLRDLFKREVVAEQALSDAVRAIRRVTTLMRQCASHFEVMETLSTREYLGFRDKLMPASGFQSGQLRQIEILMGLLDEDRIPLGLGEDYVEALRAHDGAASSAMRRVLAQKEDRPTLAEAVEEWLYRTPIEGVGPDHADADSVLDRFVESYVTAQHGEIERSAELARSRARGDDEVATLNARYEAEKQAIIEFLNPDGSQAGRRRKRIRAAMLFIVSYRELPLLAWPREVLDGLIELEQGFVIFRQRHARMVERVIGRRTGTGGSTGVDYLDGTARSYRVFRDLWAVRTYQIRKAAHPELQRSEFYDFRNG